MQPNKVLDAGEYEDGGPGGDKGLVPFEFQEELESRMYRGGANGMEDSDYGGASEGELSEMYAIAEQMDEYHFAVKVFPGQDPNNVSWIRKINLL